jgi:hypothetical protein
LLGVLFWLSLILGLANCWRASPDSLRITIKELDEFLAPARERPFGVAAGMIDDGGVVRGDCARVPELVGWSRGEFLVTEV